MNDTSQTVKNLQQEIWLSKSPEERLMQFMKDNDSLFKFWNTVSQPIEHKVDFNSEVKDKRSDD
jgi:hypothetical protein